MPAYGRRDFDFQPELRKNVVTREWVIIAKGRGKRPSDLAVPPAQGGDAPEHDAVCPFCAGNEDQTPPEVFALREHGPPNSPGWQLRVVPNKFAALRPDLPDTQRQLGIHQSRDGQGAHEVVVESPVHNRDLWEMDQREVELVIEAYRQRYLTYESGEVLRHVLIFRNHGIQAGTSLVHPHSQLIASPVISHQLQIELQGAVTYYEYLGECVFCAIMQNELRSRERLVMESDHFVVATAYAGRYPFETWILPRHHSIRFADMSEAEAADLARVLRDTLGRLSRTLNRPSYNFAIHTASPSEHNVRAYHWHMEIFPRVTTPGGFELGSDIYINVVAPEEAAQVLRAAEAPLVRAA